MTSTNASASAFGWDFQINAAIILLLDNIKAAEQIRVEGKTEDIEITLENNRKLYSQAKSVIDSDNYKNVSQKLADALTTLNTAAQDPNCENLIYVTNSPNPLNDTKTMGTFYGHTRKEFKDLPQNCKKKIFDTISKKSLTSFDVNKLSIHVFPFFTDDREERYKEVRSAISWFLHNIDADLSSITMDIMDIWQNEFFENCTDKDHLITIKKSEFIWPIIVIKSRIGSSDDCFDEIDESEWDELKRKYKRLIDNRVDRFQFAVRILADYQDYKPDNSKDKLKSFIANKWEDYKNEFSNCGLSDVIIEPLIKIIICKILKNKYTINEVRKKVGLK